jgi:hypothetical protein
LLRRLWHRDIYIYFGASSAEQTTAPSKKRCDNYYYENHEHSNHTGAAPAAIIVGHTESFQGNSEIVEFQGGREKGGRLLH